MAKYRVTGRYEVGGAAPGEVVELDPDTVNIGELLRVGLVESIEDPDLQDRAPQEKPKPRRSHAAGDGD